MVTDCIMNILKRVLAVLGAAFGLLALFYIIFAWSLTLKNFGLSVGDQLIAQRILTPLLFVALPMVIVLIKSVCRAGLVKENGITCGNQMMEKPSHISPVKHSAIYFTRRERGAISSEGPSSLQDVA